MSTFIGFTPSTTAAFSFQATLGGTQYSVSITWNIFGERYYINITDFSGNPILTRAMTASGPVLQAQFSWALGIATAATMAPHNVPIGSVVNAYISQTGSDFDGQFQLLATNAYTLTYQLATNPEEALSIAGNVNFSLNLLYGYGIGYMLYHYETQQIEYG